MEALGGVLDLHCPNLGCNSCLPGFAKHLSGIVSDDYAFGGYINGDVACILPPVPHVYGWRPGCITTSSFGERELEIRRLRSGFISRSLNLNAFPFAIQSSRFRVSSL